MLILSFVTIYANFNTHAFFLYLLSDMSIFSIREIKIELKL